MEIEGAPAETALDPRVELMIEVGENLHPIVKLLHQ